MHLLYGKDAQDKVIALVKDIKIALMVTYDTTGALLHSRPMMALQTGDDGVFWFFTAADSRKVQELQTYQTALLAYAEPEEQKYVSISGRAKVAYDRAKIDELWTEYARKWFPLGKDDPNLTLIRFEASEAEFSESHATTEGISYGYIKAFLMGETIEEHEMGRTQFHPAS